MIDRILICLHPAMPFLTEELWHALGARTTDLILASWPALSAPGPDRQADEIDWLIDLVSAIRSARTELNVAPSARLDLHAPGADADLMALLGRHEAALGRLARVAGIRGTAPPAGGMAQIVVGDSTYALPLAGVIDVGAERARLTKARDSAAAEADALARRLATPGFVERARPEAVDKARADHALRAAEVERLTGALARLA